MSDQDRCTWNEDAALQFARNYEATLAHVNEQLNHLIEVVKHHREQPNVVCPVYCYGEHYVGDVHTVVQSEEDGYVHLLLHTAITRLAGYDTR